MCELFAMSSRYPTTVQRSFEELAAHGGLRTQDVVLVASVPLTAEAWRPLDEGEVVLLAAGRQIADADGAITLPTPPT